ncbi:unnamed protein product [Schistosoma margrebowiei]|uniref:Uncharacterized protein n=1 Tax=Schistosoma margrebowiei TaxID=48269 RepID=A0A183MCE7_9TREM|nr:unnamed protein product [Schistosoma margrebowiei]
MTADKATIEGSIKQQYDATKKLAGKYDKAERPVKYKEGKFITEIQGQRNRWVEYFGKLLNRSAPLNPPDIEAAPIDLPKDVTRPTIEEIRTIIGQIKNGKAAGPDSMPVKALNSDTEEAANILYTLFRKI